MDPFGAKATGAACIMATLLAVRAAKKRTLTTTGAVTGFVVGFLLVATGLRGLTLFFFYQLGSWATKYKTIRKQQLDATASDSAVRGPTQVLAVSLVAVLLSLMHAYICGAERAIVFHVNSRNDNDFITNLSSHLTLAVLAHHATSLADTLASELGILSKAPPFLVTQPWRSVPPGTNGGVTWMGTIWSVVGGALCGLFTSAMDFLSGISPLNALRLTLFGSLCGILGSFLDSVLGATLQATYWDTERKMVFHAGATVPKTAILLTGHDLLSNEQINFVSIVLTTLFGGWVIGPLVFA